MLKVLLADDHAIVRSGILRLLSGDPRIEVLGEASDFSEAVTKAQKFRPDVLILDVHMPLGPASTSPEIDRKLSSCGAKILAMSFANDDDVRSLAKSIGAAALLDKINLAKELIPAIVELASTTNHPPGSIPATARDRGELQ